MQFKELSVYLDKLSATTSRNSMIEILADLFKAAPTDVADKVEYLLQGRVAPIFEPVELGMADKMMAKAIANAYEKDEKEVLKSFKSIGDIGAVAQQFAEKSGQKGKGNVSIAHVFDVLTSVSQASGDGSVEKKIKLVGDLFRELDPLSAKFVARIPVGKMRLGFSDMTVLDSLSWMLSGTKEHRKELERAFNVRPDIGLIVKKVKEKGIKGVADVQPTVLTPIMMARAERLSSGEEIIEKIGECAVEPKFDGFRLQCHYDGKTVRLMTRNLEDSTFMYPDIEAGIRKLKVKNVILEGEAIAYDPETGEYQPFQLTVQRKRKYGIEEAAKKIPLKLICFDLLYLDGQSFINEPYTKRRETLAKIIKGNETLLLAEEKVIGEAKELENFFDDAISRGLEGILAKRLDGTYQAGARGFNWIKFKRSYAGSLDDTLDAVVMGYNRGQGKRTSFGIGAFLIGVYDKKKDVFGTIAKIGTGLTDDEWRELHKRAEKLKAKEKPPLYDVDKMLEPDVWIDPEIVVEIRADEITRSPIHTAGRSMKPSRSGKAFEVDESGYALRFPRLERFRDDKNFKEATTLTEVEDMFKLQKKEKPKNGGE